MKKEKNVTKVDENSSILREKHTFAHEFYLILRIG